MTSQIPPISHVQSSSSPSGEGAIQAILDRHCKAYPKGIPVGCNLVIMQEGKSPTLLHAGKIPPDGPQNWGSTSKQFTAACIDKLVKQGKINYDDDIRTLCPDLPEFKLNGIVQRVTVDDLLHMRSGLPEVWASGLMAGLNAECLNNTQLLQLLNQHPGMTFSPGSKERYCNTNYYLLAKIVEDVSERPFIDYVRDEVLAPLGMQARCSIDPSCLKTIPGYDGDPASKTYMEDVTSPNLAYGTTGLIGPPSDMVKWNNAIARRDYDLLEPPNQQQGPSSESLYCRGLIAGPKDNYYRIFHGGALAGAVTIYRRYEHRDDPRKTFAFFLATNADSVPDAEKTADDIANALADKEIERAREGSPNPLVNSLKSDAQIFSGTYRCEEFGTEWILRPKEKEPGKWAVEMLPFEHQKFPRIDFDPRRDESGHLVFQFGYGNATLEKTSDGFIYHSENMAPVHFKRMPFIKYKSVAR